MPSQFVGVETPKTTDDSNGLAAIKIPFLNNIVSIVTDQEDKNKEPLFKNKEGQLFKSDGTIWDNSETVDSNFSNDVRRGSKGNKDNNAICGTEASSPKNSQMIDDSLNLDASSSKLDNFDNHNSNKSQLPFLNQTGTLGFLNTDNEINFLSSNRMMATLLGNGISDQSSNETSYYGNLKANFVMQPVSVITGEFYISSLDIKLGGPMPLEIQRIYSSQNQADSCLGHGWRFSYFPYLILSDDNNNSSNLIYASETDGSVVAYRYDPNKFFWYPQSSDNPNLINNSDGTLGPNKNLYNNRIIKTVIEGIDVYLLKGYDGSIRTFKTRSFKIWIPPYDKPSKTVTQPCLDTWKDNKGNELHFTFGEQNGESGQLTNVTSSNGNRINFHYDCFWSFN